LGETQGSFSNNVARDKRLGEIRYRGRKGRTKKATNLRKRASRRSRRCLGEPETGAGQRGPGRKKGYRDRKVDAIERKRRKSFTE